MSKTLFNEFENVSSKQWKQKIQVDLKGEDYNKTLIWTSNEGIDVKPFYHLDDVDEFCNVNFSKDGWKINQEILVSNSLNANITALDFIENGAESITFNIINSLIQIEELLKDIDLSLIEIHFKFSFLSHEFIKQLKPNLKSSTSHIHTDIIGNLAKSGNWFNNLNNDHNQFNDIVKATSCFSIDASLYQNAGANITQQLAYALAHTNEYLNHLDSSLKKEELEQIKVIFNVAIGTNYFFEIAKLRALRALWQTLARAYGIRTKCHIIAKPTRRNKTIYDYNTNMLRTTSECMSAILGNADTICNLSYDAIYHKPNEFGNRISRNQLLILKHESYFNTVNNASDGSYYIENLTNQLANKALDLFKSIENNGGFLKQLKEGTIQRKIKESAKKEQEQFNNKEEILLGTNKHPNSNDKMKSELEINPFVKNNPRKTLIEPIIEKRLAENLEQERLKTE